MADQLAVDLSKFIDLSGAVHGIIQDLSGVALSQSGLIGKLAKLVVAAWSVNLSEDKVQAQVLAAARYLVSKAVPAGERALVLSFVESSAPAIVVALQSVADEVKAYLLKQASVVQTKVVEKVAVACNNKPACSPLLSWIQGLLKKKVADAAVPAEPVASVPATPAAPVETPAAPVEAPAAPAESALPEVPAAPVEAAVETPVVADPVAVPAVEAVTAAVEAVAAVAEAVETPVAETLAPVPEEEKQPVV